MSTTGIQQFSFLNLVGAVVQYERFGSVLAAGNLGSDGQADLTIGAPSHPVAGLNRAGVVSMVFGTPSGLPLDNNKLVHMSTGSQDGAAFGSALAAAQLGGDAYLDLAVGVLNWDVSSAVTNAGAVSIRYGTATGPAATTSDQWWTAVTPVHQAKFGGALPQ